VALDRSLCALPSIARRTTRRPDIFAESQQQVVHPMSFETIVIIVVIVLIVLFVLGYFGRGRRRG